MASGMAPKAAAMAVAPTTEETARMVPNGEIEAAGQKRHHLAHGDDGQVDRLAHHVHQVAPGQEVVRQQGEDDDQAR